MRTLRLDLHLHTNHSYDSDLNPEVLINSARAAGLEAVAICDHDTMSAVELIKRYALDMLVIPGMEITTERGIHLIGLFLKEDIVSRNLLDVIDEIHAQHALVVLPHPFRARTGLLHEHDGAKPYDGEIIEKVISRLDLVESINGHSTQEELLNTEKFFRTYSEIPQIASSDAHHLEQIGKVRTELEDVDGKTLADVRRALLSAPRFLRYEAYDASGPTDRRKHLPAVGKGIFSKAKKLIPASFRKAAGDANKATLEKYPESRDRGK